LRRAHHFNLDTTVGTSAGAHSRDPLALPTLRAMTNLTKPDFSKEAGRFLRWRKKNRWHR
jgi:hypothetical protein